MDDILDEFQGRRGQTLVNIDIDDEVDQPIFKSRRFSAGKFKRSSRLLMATQETVPESSVRRKIHSKKSLLNSPRIAKPLVMNVGDKLRYSKDNKSLKNRITLSGGMSSILTAALKTAVAADIQENLMKSPDFRKSSRKSKKSLFHDPMVLMQSVKHHRNFLSTLEATAVIAVFDKIIDELAVLKSLLPQCCMKDVLPDYQNIDERFGKEESASSPNMDEKPKNEDLEKLQKDRAFIEEVLVKTSKDMETENSFWTLFSVVVNKHKMDRDEEELVERWPVVRKQLRELRAELRQATEMLGPQALSRALVSLRQQAKFMMLEEEARLEHELYMWERRRHVDLEQMGDTLIKARNTLDAARQHTESMREEALLGVLEARQVLVKEAMGKDKGKKGKGGKGRK